jgi:RNA-directed DNA polymerase
LERSQDELGKPTAPDRGTAGSGETVKPASHSQSAEQSSVHNEGKSTGTSDSLWERIGERQNLYAALERVEANGGAPGIDGMTVKELRPYRKRHWLEVRASLDAEKYQPQPVRRVELPKPDGGARLLGIPTVLDRFLQQAVAQILTPRFEPVFSPHSYGFRPGRSAHQAVKAAQAYVEAGYDWVVDLDWEKFFDRVNHDKSTGRPMSR